MLTPPAQYNMSCWTVLVIEGQALQSYVSLHGAGRATNDLSKQPQNWAMGRKSRSRHSTKTSTGGPLPTYFCSMAPTSITRWSKTAGGGGIGSMRRQIRCWKGWRTKREMRRKACGLIRSRCHRGSGGKSGGSVGEFHDAGRSV